MSNLYYLREYSTFNNTQELNYHVKQHTNKRYHDMNETQRQVLQVISQYSVKHAGACHLKVETIAKAIGKSDRTVIRAINTLVELKVIERLSTTRRVSGGQGANIYVILPYVTREMSQRIEDEKPRQVRDSTPIVEKDTANLLSYYINSINTSCKISQTPYKAFKASIQTFLGDSIYINNHDNKRLVSRLYGVYLAQTKQLRNVYKNGELIDIATKAIRITFATTKRKKLQNIAGYFNGILSNLLDELCDEEISRVLAM